MQLGIFSKTYEGTLEHVFQKMEQDQLTCTQFNLSSAGMESMPLTYDRAVLDKIKDAARRHHIELVALSGTFNMIDPDEEKRQDGIQRFAVLCEIAAYLETPIITLCTGSKNRESKWKWHDDNDSNDAWEDLLETTKQLLPMAEAHHLTLGIEVEASNVIHSPALARKYLDLFQNDHLKIVMDGANLFHPKQIETMQATLSEAFALLGNDICLAHAKDLASDQDIQFVAAGTGILDYDTYLQLLKNYHYEGALIIHGLTEAQVAESKTFLERKLSYAL